MNPFGHHLTNILLHAINSFIVTLLFFSLLEVARRSRPRSAPAKSPSPRITCAAAALLFGLHPLHVESIAWVSERKDLLCGVFFLLSLTTYVRYAVSSNLPSARADRVPRFFTSSYLLPLGFFVLALLSKPMAVSLPVVLLILDFYPLKRLTKAGAPRIIVEKLPYFLRAAASSVVTIQAQRSTTSIVPLDTIPLSQRLFTVATSPLAYLAKILVPVNLLPLYPYPAPASSSAVAPIASLVVLLIITAFCVRTVHKVYLAAWLYYLSTLFPVLGIIQVGNQSMADRYTYLPSLGPFLVIGLGTAWLYDRMSEQGASRRALRLAAVAAASAILVLISGMTVRQIGVWRNSIVFWNHLIDRMTEKAPLAYNNLGLALEKTGQLDDAIKAYQDAIRLRPAFQAAHNNLGIAYRSKGWSSLAIEEFRTVISLNEKHAEAHNNLGNLYQEAGLLDEAITQYRAALDLDPDNAVAHNNLGNTYARNNQIEAAIEQYNYAVRVNPDYAEAHCNLGNAYASKGMREAGISEYVRAISLKPDFKEAHFNLGLVYREKGLVELARREFQLVVRLDPADQEARRMLEGIMATSAAPGWR